MTDDDTDGRDVARRTYLKGVAAGSAVGLGGMATMSGTAHQVNGVGEHAVAEFCGTFSPGPQVQQCLACIEERCDGEVNPLTPLYTGLSGQCFEPPVVPDGADYIALKAGQNCYVTSVDDNTTFCLPPGSPDISNATFYRCGGEPTPAIVDFDVTCEAITVTTENVPDGQALTAAVTFLDADGNESEAAFQAIVENGTATFDLPGDLNPTHLVVTLDDTVLLEQDVVATDAPCTPEPPTPPVPDDPRIDDVEVTCEAIIITTSDILEGATIYATVSFVGDVTEMYDVTVDADGVAVVPLPGDLDPSNLAVAYDDELLFDMNVQAVDAPCADVPPKPPEPPAEPPEKPPEPPELPELPEEPPENEKEFKKLLHECKSFERKYERYEKRLEKST